MSTDKRILIVDDEESNVIYISQILEDHGYEYAVARNGGEALEMMEEEAPRLVLLDIMMPRKTGIGVFQRMKRNPKLEKVPIVIVTGASAVTGVDMVTGEQASKESYDDDLTRRMGVLLREKLKGITPDGFIEKPIHPPTLIAKIEELLA
jgi:CheY-like chemotaxis protein